MNAKIRKRVFRSLFTVVFLAMMMLPCSMPRRDRLKLHDALERADVVKLYGVSPGAERRVYTDLDQVEIESIHRLGPDSVGELQRLFSWINVFQWSIAGSCHRPTHVIELWQDQVALLRIFISFECNSMQLAGSEPHGIPMTWDLEGFFRVHQAPTVDPLR